MARANQRVRDAAGRAGVYLWQIAGRLGITDGNFSRKLRFELSQEETETILRIIDELRRENGHES